MNLQEAIIILLKEKYQRQQIVEDWDIPDKLIEAIDTIMRHLPTSFSS